MKGFVHNTYFRILAPPVYGILIYLLVLLIHNQVSDLKSLFVNQELYVMAVLALISFESMRMTILLVAKAELTFQQRILLQLCSTTGIGVTMVLLAITLYFKFVIGFEISSSEVMVFGTIFIFTALLYNALYFANEYIHRENTQRVAAEKKMQENLESEFISFRQEINPNLLYDSLEELILCLRSQPEKAEELIDSLAFLYRYQLIHRQKEFVPLAEELEAVDHLLNLLNQKKQNNIRWKNEMGGRESIMVRPGALVTTIDSIVRNSLISSHSPMNLSLMEEDEDYFMLHYQGNDKLQPHEESLASFLELQRSYSVYSDHPFVQVKTGKENYIKFPLVRLDQAVLSPV